MRRLNGEFSCGVDLSSRPADERVWPLTIRAAEAVPQNLKASHRLRPPFPASRTSVS